MIVTRQSLAPLLREQRTKAHLSRAKVGRACGLSEATIEALEKGERRLTAPLLDALCGVSALRLPPLQVLGGGGTCPAAPPIPQCLLPPPPPLCVTVARFPVWLAREVSWLPRPRVEACCAAAPLGRCLSREARQELLDALADQLVGFTVAEVTEALFRAAARKTTSYSAVARILGVSRRAVYGYLPARRPRHFYLALDPTETPYVALDRTETETP